MKRVIHYFLIFILLYTLFFLKGCFFLNTNRDIINEKEIQDTLDTQQTAARIYYELLEKNDDQAGLKVLEFLSLQPNVNQVELLEDGSIWIEYHCGLNGFIIPAFFDHSSELQNSGIPNIGTLWPTSSLSGSTPKAFIGIPFKDLVWVESEVDDLAKYLQHAGFQVVIKQGEEVSVDIMESLSEYDFIYLRTHGLHKIGSTYIVTGERIPSIFERIKTYLLTWKTKIGLASVGKDTFYALHSDFFASQSYKKNAIVVIDACHSLRTKEMANAFLRNGAAVYLGWTDTVPIACVTEATLTILRFVLEHGKSVEESFTTAIEDLPLLCKASDVICESRSNASKNSVRDLYPVKVYPPDTGIRFNKNLGCLEYKNGIKVCKVGLKTGEYYYTTNLEYEGNGDWKILSTSRIYPPEDILLPASAAGTEITVQFKYEVHLGHLNRYFTAVITPGGYTYVKDFTHPFASSGTYVGELKCIAPSAGETKIYTIQGQMSSAPGGETNADSETVSFKITVSPISSISGEIVQVSVSPPSPIPVGQQVSFSCTVRNTGTVRHTFVVVQYLLYQSVTEATISIPITLDPQEEQSVELVRHVCSLPGLWVFPIVLMNESQQVVDFEVGYLAVVPFNAISGKIVSTHMNPSNKVQAGQQVVFRCVVRNISNAPQGLEVSLFIFTPEIEKIINLGIRSYYIHNSFVYLEPNDERTIEVTHVFDADQTGIWGYVFLLGNETYLLDAKPCPAALFIVY